MLIDTVAMVSVLKEFIEEFNLEKPYENPHIENIQNNMLTIMFGEFEKIYDKNQVILSKTDDINKQREIYDRNKNNAKYSTEFMTNPINYAQVAINMLTDKTATEWDGRCAPCHGLPNINRYNVGERYFKVDYKSTYLKILHSSLAECYNIYQSLEKKSKKENKSEIFEKMFGNKCSALYYLLLEYAEFAEHLLSNKSKTHGFKCVESSVKPNESEIYKYKLKLPAPSTSKPIEMSDKMQQILHNMCETITVSIETNNNNHSCNGSNKISHTVNKKDWDRLEEHKKLIDKTFCDIVAYGYMQAKLLKLESVKIYTDIVANLKLAVSHEKVGQAMGVVFENTLSQVNIYTLDDLDIKNSWDNSEKCFSFMTKSVTSYSNSKKMLASLEDEDMANMPQTAERIADLKKEIKSSNDYLVTLFTQYIAVKRRELGE